MRSAGILLSHCLVVPHEGTWIEIDDVFRTMVEKMVVPHEGTWIEIIYLFQIDWLILSFPTRERGLK